MKRDVEIVETKEIRMNRWVDGVRVEDPPRKPTADDLPFSVYVDGAFHGSCRTRAKAEKAAEMERARDETVTERAVRILREVCKSAESVTVWHTGGGCLACGVALGDAGHVMVTDEMMGYAIPSECEDGDLGYTVGVYGPESADPMEIGDEWVESLSGHANTDAEMVAMVRKGIEHLTR